MYEESLYFHTSSIVLYLLLLACQLIFVLLNKAYDEISSTVLKLVSVTSHLLLFIFETFRKCKFISFFKMQPAEEKYDANPDHYMNYFMQEISYGEQIITEGNLEAGVDHLIRTIIECNRAQELFGILQETLPDEVLALLVYKLVNFNAKTKDKSDGKSIQPAILKAAADADVDVADLKRKEQ